MDNISPVRCLLQMGENQLAIEDARKAVMISSQSIPALETLGNLNKKQGWQHP